MKIMNLVWIAIILVIGYWVGMNYPGVIPLPRMPKPGM